MTQKSLRLPRPRLSLSVGIVGHRENKLIDETLAPTLASLRHVYASIDAGLGAISKQRGAAIYAIGDPLVRLLSALASGADRLGVHAAPDHWRIEAVLPMPRAIYADDFEDPNAAEGGPVLAEYNQMLSRVDTVTEMTMLASAGARSSSGTARPPPVPAAPPRSSPRRSIPDASSSGSIPRFLPRRGFSKARRRLSPRKAFPGR